MFAGYKTYVAAALVAAFGVLAMTDWVSFLNDPGAGITAIVTSVIFAVLRAVTNTPGAVQLVWVDKETREEAKKAIE